MKRLMAVILWIVVLLPGTMSIGRDMAKESQIENQLGSINPALVQTFREAREALDKRDYLQATGLLRKVCEAAPEFDAAQRRLGYALARIGKSQEAMVHARRAVEIRRTSENLSNLAATILSSQGASTDRETKLGALGLLKEAVSRAADQDSADLTAVARLSLELDDDAAFRNAATLLRSHFPNLALTHYYSAVLAVRSGDWDFSKDEIQKAQEMGFPASEAEAFLKTAGSHRKMELSDIAVIVGWSLVAWAGGIVLLCGFGFALSKLTLWQIQKGDAKTPISRGEHRLRRIYRWVVNLAGLYYYVSLPIVLVLVLAVFGGIVCLFFYIGTIPIKLVVILVIGGIMTVVSLVRSFFVKINVTDPGRVLQRSEAEPLWKLAEEVAASVKTRPVDEIRITNGTDLCVYERGSWRQKLQNRAKRILVLGAALLQDFRQEDFRCVLAHEYGHFSHRDTAGGEIAMRVQSDMLKFYFAMRAAGQATTFNAAFQFLRIYNFIFRRISHGATRLQEVLADRVAARLYGAAAFTGGLTHVIRQGVAFEKRANLEVAAAIKEARPLQNLYALDAFDAATEKADFHKRILRETTDDDTNPSPKDRFRYVAGLVSQNPAPTEGFVWDLFADREAIIQEMLAELEKLLARHRAAR